MKRRLIPWLIAVIAVSGVAWLSFVPEPVIRFVGLQRDGQNRWALLRIENSSRHPFAYLGLTESRPRFSYRFPKPSGWQVVDLPTCSRPMTIPARSSVDIRVPSPPDPGPFQIGIAFKRGTAPEFYNPSRYYRIRYLVWRLGLIPTANETPHPIWSPTIGT